MLGPDRLYDDRLPLDLRGRLTAAEAVGYLAAEDRHAIEQADEIVRERLRTEGNRKARRAAAAWARRRG